VLASSVTWGAVPFATDPSPDNVSFQAYIEKWAKICDNIISYQYVVQFTNLVSPFPNLRVLQPNIQYVVEHGAKGLFLQGNRESGGEFAELRAYLLAKLAWNPYCDIDEVMDDFLQGYYGAAATPIRKYIDLMHDALEASGQSLKTVGNPRDYYDDEGYLCPQMIEEYDRLFNEAERLVADDEEILLRVQIARMPLMYAKLEVGYGDVATRINIAEKLFDLAKRSGLLTFTEGCVSPERYNAQVMAALAYEGQRPICTPVRVATPPQIDGQLTDACWSQAPVLTNFVVLDSQQPAQPQTEVQVVFDEQALYIGVRCLEPHPELLVAVHQQRDSAVYTDDAVEVFLDPGCIPGHRYQFVVNVANVQFDLLDGDAAWDAQWHSATVVGEGEWTLELAIPWSVFGLEGPGEGLWSANFCRDHLAGEEQLQCSSWSPAQGGFHDTSKFGHLALPN